MRERLISVAIQQFGEHGFAGASTRDIAAAADTTMSNITYHFGGKDGLYRAAAEALVTRFWEVAQAAQAAAPQGDPIGELCALLRAIGGFMLGDEAAPASCFVSREQQNPESPMREFFRRDFLPLSQSHAANIRALDPSLSQEQAVATFFYLVSMAISLRSSRMSLCTVMEVDDIDESLKALLLDRLEAIARMVLEAKR